VQLRRELEGERLLGLSGVLSIGLGVALAAFPAMGMVALVWAVGVYAIVAGALSLALGYKLRQLGRAKTTLSGRPERERAGSTR